MIDKEMEEFKKDLASMSEEDRLNMEKEIQEMVTEYRNSKPTEKEKKFRKFLKQVETTRKNTLKFMTEEVK